MSDKDLGPKTWYVDVEYQGMPRLIATGVLETDAGLLLVDPGPTSSLDGLRRGLEARGYGLGDVHALLLTHIHLDHAGAAGSIVAAHPGVQVYVHEIGARHLVAPEKLLTSARRLYGEAMDALWGDFLPVPAANVHRLHGGETLEIGGREIEVAYTPGHAIHHVSYYDPATEMAFVGDVAGMRVAGVEYIFPVTPPPDIDLLAWHQSIAAVWKWKPKRLFLTHFGPSDYPDFHLDEFEEQLGRWSALVRFALQDEEEETDDAALAAAFNEEILAEMAEQLPPGDLMLYEQFGQPLVCWQGLARYWRKRWEAEAHEAEISAESSYQGHHLSVIEPAGDGQAPGRPPTDDGPETRL